jgi:hypothetical protein
VVKGELDPSQDQPDKFAEPMRILVTEEHFVWLTLQCEQMGTRKRQLIFNALKEWLSRTDPSKLPTKDLSEMVFLALEDFRWRHRAEFLPLNEKRN